MAWACEEVASHNRGDSSQENGARGGKLKGNFAGTLRGDGHVLRRKLIRDRDSRLQVADKNEAGVFQGKSQFLWTSGKAELPVHGGGDAVQQARGVCQQDGNAALAVFGLGKQIRRDPLGIGGVVRNDEDLAWTGQQIDRDLPKDLAFGFDDICVPGPKYLLHRMDGLCPKRERGNGLGSAHAINFRGAAFGECAEQCRLHRAVHG